MPPMTFATSDSNAAAWFASVMRRDAVVRVLRELLGDREKLRGRTVALAATLGERFALDLPGLLNRLQRDELESVAAELEVSTAGSIGELRARLWMVGAEREARGRSLLGSELQPVPVVLRGRLVMLAEGEGTGPTPEELPAPIVDPPDGDPAPPDHEPDSLEELLANADAIVGASLAPRGRNKGGFGNQVATLLGVIERGHSEPDWRGEVEIKTVPVVRDRAGWWRVKEDPAVSMQGASPLAKLRRVLWIPCVPEPGGGARVLSWYYQEWSPRIAALVQAYLHTRPKGGAGATTRGWYLHKRFFVDSGLLRALNG